jgi:Family of unknown function (DUF6502)
VSTDTNNRQLLIASAMKRVLRPFIKLMLANNLTYTLIIDVLKTLFVEVADQEFAENGRRLTDSRISLMSGVHRKDVRRLRELQPGVEDVMPDNVSLGSQLIALWNANPKYLNADGTAKPLPRFAAANDSESFESLVRSLSTDIHPRAVLDEWLRLGIARVDEQNVVHLTTDMYIAQEGFEEKVFYFGHNLHDHAQAAVANVLSQTTNGQPLSFLERCVHYDTLTMASVAEIGELAKKQGMKTLREVNKIADGRGESDKNLPQANMRMTYGIYYYYEPMQVDNSALNVEDNQHG